MSLAYQYDINGYYAGAIECYGLLPNNATFVAPPVKRNGFVLRWNGTLWEQVEDHVGEEGYVDGKPFKIEEFGPYPEGWSNTPPPPTQEELFTRLRDARRARLAEYDESVAQLLRQKRSGEDVDELLEEWDRYADALCTLPQQEGAPWDGGGDDTPWPTKPNSVKANQAPDS